MYINAYGEHTPETCPMFNKDTRDTMRAAAPGLDSLANETKVKPVSWYHVALGHTFNIVFETESAENVETFLLKSGLASFNKLRIEEVVPIQKVVEKLSQL
jgi:hypothetical protein